MKSNWTHSKITEVFKPRPTLQNVPYLKSNVDKVELFSGMVGPFYFDRQPLKDVSKMLQSVVEKKTDWYIGQVDRSNKMHGAGIYLWQ